MRRTNESTRVPLAYTLFKTDRTYRIVFEFNTMASCTTLYYVVRLGLARVRSSSNFADDALESRSGILLQPAARVRSILRSNNDTRCV